ncbi:chloride channel protein [Flavobacterium sp. N1994]|uniref:chloride channel protein n=1 Tax=Flavobacterium sp. N1994 TaxID=2986827 RepID=UPI0022227D90|nr:chloride channel protein [Flavobacterium sp. N1994]
MHFTKIRSRYHFHLFQKLVLASLLIGFLSTFLSLALKHITEKYESILFFKASTNWIYFLLFPILGLSVIYLLRHYLFQKKANKGITEIFEAIQSKSKQLPLYKIPSHFINGIVTVIFGGSTGIEVSTVVATAAIGNTTSKKDKLLSNYKTELICAGITAGITVLFSSPIAGILFSMEVITKKRNWVFFLTNGIALLTSLGLLLFVDEKPLFAITITTWHVHAIPYFILLGILAGLNSVYLTKMVLFFKLQFGKIPFHYHRILLGATILTICLLLLPQLYGEGYSAVKGLFSQANSSITLLSIATLVGVILLKPVITSATLAAGGDGGVFAPSLVIGAFLGFFVATIINHSFHANVIPMNFVVIGMAAVLSASIQAPFTALFLVCGMIHNYTLFFPLLMVCLIAKQTSKMIFPFTVYNYNASLK